MPFVITSFSLLITVLNTIPLHYVPLRYNSWTHSLKISSVSVDQSVQGDKSKRILQLARILSGHSVVVMTRDGQTLAGVTDDSKITLWNLKTGTKIRTIAGHALPILSLAISPDGKLLASAGHDKTIKIWNLQTGEEIRTLVGHRSWIEAIAISPDGQTLATGGWGNIIKLWNLTIGEEIGTLKEARNPVETLHATSLHIFCQIFNLPPTQTS
ncbi:MAG TPA: hypothetical protein V6D30_08270 [Leptolyngbyaceae cyanobacterium]